jgi:hypothetical protein
MLHPNACWSPDPLVLQNVIIFDDKGFFFYGMGFELRASRLQSSHSTTWATLSVHFALVILEMGGSLKLFAQASLKLQSSWSQPPK